MTWWTVCWIVRLVVVGVLSASSACAAAAICVGDCDDSHMVSIGELITGVNISLGFAELSGCEAFDADHSGDVGINELILGVNALLLGCPPDATPTVTDTAAPSAAPATPDTPTPTPTFTLGVFTTVTPTPKPTDVTLYIGSANGSAGEVVTIGVTLATAGHKVAGTQNEIQFTAEARIQNAGGHPDCRANSAITDKHIATLFLPLGCDPDTTCDRAKVLTYSSQNLDPIEDGSLLYTCQVAIADNAPISAVQLGCANALAGSTPPIQGYTTDCAAGTIAIGGAEPVADQRATARSSQQATVALQATKCTGDCDSSLDISTSELLLMVHLALGDQSPSLCLNADGDDNGAVDIVDLLRTIFAFFNGCP